MARKFNIVLASSSPYRQQLLRNLGFPFEVRPPHIDETPLDGESPHALVARLAEEKARAVAIDNEHSLIIGSDQVADHGGVIIGKPENHEAAVDQLTYASGREIQLYTGLAVLNAYTGQLQRIVEPYRVQFRHLLPEEIESYLRFEQPYNCCGSLKAEGAGISLLSRLSGDDPNALIGLPMIQLCNMLRNEGMAFF